MKSEIKEKDSDYPKLMKFPETDTVVCFVEEEYGIVVYPTNHTHFMKFTYWKMDRFLRFNDTVELSNQ